MAFVEFDDLRRRQLQSRPPTLQLDLGREQALTGVYWIPVFEVLENGA